MANQFFVAVEWDDEAKVWYVADSDVPGLTAEAASIDALGEKLRLLVPELLEYNAHLLPEAQSEDGLVHLRMESSFGIERALAS